MTNDELFDLDDEDLDSDEDPFADVDSPAKPALRTLDEFEAEVDRKIKILMSRKNDVNERRDAAIWLGESGAPKAITTLTTIYEKDKKNKKVQDAAAYALGQFKALDEAIIREDDETVIEALGKEENEGIVQLLEDIALRDERGRRLRIPTRVMVLFQALLVVSLVGLIALNVTLSGAGVTQGDRLAMRGQGTLAERTVNEIGLRTDELEDDTQTLQQQLNNVRDGAALQCGAAFKNPADFPLDPQVGTQFASVQSVSDRYNDLRLDFISAKQSFDTACSASETVSAEATSVSLTSLSSILSAIPALKSEIEAVRQAVNSAVTATANAQATGDAAQSTSNAPTAVPTEGPTITSTPGLASSEITRHAAAMISLVDAATGQRGFNTLLAQYWADIRDNGSTIGCNTAAPTIPENYVLTEEEKRLAPDLANALVQLDTGLALVRQGWTLFTNACTAGTLAQNYQLGLEVSNNANAIFDEALLILDVLTKR